MKKYLDFACEVYKMDFPYVDVSKLRNEGELLVIRVFVDKDGTSDNGENFIFSAYDSTEDNERVLNNLKAFIGYGD